MGNEVDLMFAGKFALLVLGILLAAYPCGLFGPGSLLPGLGLGFDQLVALAVVAALFFVAVPWLRKRRGDGYPGNIATRTPEDILRERYARGEVDRTQFFLMLDDLRSQSPRKV
jgi:uncharacterized membrane protein